MKPHSRNNHKVNINLHRKCQFFIGETTAHIPLHRVDTVFVIFALFTSDGIPTSRYLAFVITLYTKTKTKQCKDLQCYITYANYQQYTSNNLDCWDIYLRNASQT